MEMVNLLMSAEVDAVCGAGYRERSEERDSSATGTGNEPGTPAADEGSAISGPARRNPIPNRYQGRPAIRASGGQFGRPIPPLHEGTRARPDRPVG